MEWSERSIGEIRVIKGIREIGGMGLLKGVNGGMV